LSQTSQPGSVQQINQIIIALTTIVAALQIFERRARRDQQVLRQVLGEHKKEMLNAEAEILKPVLATLEFIEQRLAESPPQLPAIQENQARERSPETTITERPEEQLSAFAELPSQNKSAISFPTPIPNITPTDLEAGVIAMALKLHEENGALQHFTHVKAEKIAHMIEAQAGINLGRRPIKDAAGPSDFLQLRNVEDRASTAKYFDFKKGPGGTYQLRKLEGFDQLIERSRAALGEHCVEVDRLLRWMLPLNVKQAEIVATVFAAWNNLLLDGNQPTDEEIVYEARENWHPNKLKIERWKFFAAVQWLRKRERVPHGKGRPVRHKRAR